MTKRVSGGIKKALPSQSQLKIITKLGMDVAYGYVGDKP
jgi:hypothetical protein